MMDRLTSNKPVKEMGMLELACNCTFIKNGDAWYRDYEREINVRDLVRAILSEYESEEYDSKYNSDDRLDEYLQNWMQLCPEDNFYGLLTAFYNMAWSHAELRERLKHYEDLEEQGKLLKLPCKPGDTVYIISKCKNFPQVLDGSLYDFDGSLGDATGYYCPYDLNDKCPHDCEEFTGCSDYKDKNAVFEDYVSYLQITEDGLYVFCENSGLFAKFGEDIFSSAQEAKEALERIKK